MIVNYYNVQEVQKNAIPKVEGTLEFGNTLFGTYLNVGASDLVIQAIYACAGTASGGAATITCVYVVKGSDGAANPSQV